MVNKIQSYYICIESLRKWDVFSLSKRYGVDFLIVRLNELPTILLENLKAFSDTLQKKILLDDKVVNCIVRLLDSGIKSETINTKAECVGDITKYQYKQIEDIMIDNKIPDKYIPIYLNYYQVLCLNEFEKSILWQSLKNLEMHDCNIEELSEKIKNLMYTPLLAGTMLAQINEYKQALEKLGSEEALYGFLSELDGINSLLELTDSTYTQVVQGLPQIVQLLPHIISYFEKDAAAMFLERWLENDSLLYDLERLKNKVANMSKDELHTLVKSKVGYRSAIYGALYTYVPQRDQEADIIIFALQNKKRQFLKLVEDNVALFQSIPSHSFFFKKCFYEDIININALNQRNLKEIIELRMVVIYDEDYKKVSVK